MLIGLVDLLRLPLLQNTSNLDGLNVNFHCGTVNLTYSNINSPTSERKIPTKVRNLK